MHCLRYGNTVHKRRIGHDERTPWPNNTLQTKTLRSRTGTMPTLPRFGAVSFPARAGTNPEGHEEACTTIDRVREQQSTAPRDRRLESRAGCCAPEVGSYRLARAWMMHSPPKSACLIHLRREMRDKQYDDEEYDVRLRRHPEPSRGVAVHSILATAGA